MAVLDIIQRDNPTLRKRAKKVMDFKNDRLQTLIDDMVETMLDAPGVGLAAPQVDVSQRLIVVRLPDESEEDREEHGEQAGKIYIVANPKITKESKKIVSGIEGCLSIPDLLGEVDRHETVVVTGQDRHGKDFRIKAKGWLARVFQHEIDHLDGILFIDRTDQLFRPKDEAGDDEEDNADAKAEAGAEVISD